MPRTRPGLPLVCAATAGLMAAALLTVGPPGIDTPAHLFMTWVFRHAGFQLWNNYWYDGRYDFVGYSVLFYPLAAAVGRVGARRWPRRRCWPTRSPPWAGASGARPRTRPCLDAGGDRHGDLLRLGRLPVPGRRCRRGGRARLRPAPAADRVRRGDARLARLLAARVRPPGGRARELRRGRAQPARRRPPQQGRRGRARRDGRRVRHPAARVPVGRLVPVPPERPAGRGPVLGRGPLPDRRAARGRAACGWCSSPTCS